MKKIRSKNNKNIFVNNLVNRLISLSLATIMPLSASGCTKKENLYDEEINNNIIYYDLDDYNLKNSKEYYEYDITVLNDRIDEIKNIRYISNYDDFDNYNIYEKPSLELSNILIHNDLPDPKYYPINYSWYNDGLIDYELLREKICENNTLAEIENTDEILEIINVIPFVITKNIEFIKNHNSEFDFNVPFYNLNNLVVGITKKDDCAACYEHFSNRILVNYDYVKNYASLNNVLSHECFHLLLNKCADYGEYYYNGCAIDSITTMESPLMHTFFLELVTDDFSYEAFGETPDDLYEVERNNLNLICEATGTDINYFKNAVLTSTNMDIINAFEPEFRCANYVYSIFNAIDKYCSYSYFDENWDYELFKNASFNYAKVGLLKNYYAKIIKQIEIGNITKDEARKLINDKKELFNKMDLTSIINDNYSECINELDAIFQKSIDSRFTK